MHSGEIYVKVLHHPHKEPCHGWILLQPSSPVQRANHHHCHHHPHHD